ncbi:hypothetical protein Y032_0131g1600 [Ancylostoma ceylanicum]|uniref:Uncharacterized protein n=1 Tax=Ancylostoma ceylanicum TaxID=53326 RepID=A0A016T5X9_9BILA|nr:hypothetical protein Y032_0131g1600 [Ancylostoma ceylanicum]
MLYLLLSVLIIRYKNGCDIRMKSKNLPFLVVRTVIASSEAQPTNELLSVIEGRPLREAGNGTPGSFGVDPSKSVPNYRRLPIESPARSADKPWNEFAPALLGGKLASEVVEKTQCQKLTETLLKERRAHHGRRVRASHTTRSRSRKRERKSEDRYDTPPSVNIVGCEREVSIEPVGDYECTGLSACHAAPKQLKTGDLKKVHPRILGMGGIAVSLLDLNTP